MLTGPAHDAPLPGRANPHSRQRGVLTPAQALVAWLASAFAMMCVGPLLHLLALRVSGGSVDAARLADPARSPLLNDPTWISLGTVVNELTVASVLALWLLGVKPPLAQALPLTIPPAGSVVGAVLLVFGLGPFAEACGVLVQRGLQSDVTIANVVLSAAGGKSALEFSVVLLCISLLPALVEEAMFRGAVTGAFAQRSRVAQVALPALLFGVFHFEPTQVAGTIVLGLGFGLARVLSNSLWPSVVAHGLFNALVLVGARFDNSAPDWQIRLGPLLVGALLTAAGLVLLLRSRVRVSPGTTPAPEAPAPS